MKSKHIYCVRCRRVAVETEGERCDHCVEVESARAPLCLTDVSGAGPRARSTAELHARLLGGAEDALTLLSAGMQRGTQARELKDLATAASVLMRAARTIEDSTPDDEAPPSLEDLERAEAEAARLLELKRGRG